MYKPDEIIVMKDIKEEPVTRRILQECSDIPVRYVQSNQSGEIRSASHLLSGIKDLRRRIATGKRILALVSTTDAIGTFQMPDPRMGCPEFPKLVLVSNGCPYRCEWCFLKGTYRGVFPFMAVRVRYDEIKQRIRNTVCRPSKPIMFNNGELRDSLALEHLTHAAESFIPFFGELPNAYLFMLTKSANIEPILDLAHNGHTIIAWSMNAPEVSQEFEVGAPPFERRLEAARRVQAAGYPVRIRLDPIVPLGDWKRRYARTIRRIFERTTPDRITLGTLRFEEASVRNRHSYIPPESCLLREMEKMQPMLEPMQIPTGKKDKNGQMKMKTSVGKVSYSEELRVKVFRFVISEIRRHFDGPLALCKETETVWRSVGLDPACCECVCQYDHAGLFTA